MKSIRLDVALLDGSIVTFVQSYMANGEYWYECITPDSPYSIFVHRSEIDFFTNVYFQG